MDQNGHDLMPNPQKAIVINQMDAPGSKTSNVMAITSLVLGIISILSCFGFGFGIILGIIGFIYGIICLAQKRPQQEMATVGLITSLIGILLGIGFLFLALMYYYYL